MEVFVLSVLSIIALLAVFLRYAEIMLSRNDAAIYKRLSAANEFASVINTDDAKDFYYLNSALVDANSNPVEIPCETGDYKLLFSGFACGSQIPEHCCRVAVDEVQMERRGQEAILFFLRPAANIISEWKVISVSEHHIVCEHKVMGKLELPKKIYVAAVPDLVIRLVSFVSKTSAGWLLQYKAMA